MKLQTFNSGKNTRLAPHLLPISAGVEYTNIDNESGELIPVKKKATTGLLMEEWAFYFEADGNWVHSATLRDYLEYQDTLYYTEPNEVPKSWDGTTERLLGIDEPSLAPTIPSTGAGVLTGTYVYLYTYYNSAKGIESPPSLLSPEVIASSNSINLATLEPSTDPQVDQKRIYRVGGNIAVFSLVDTIANATTIYTDNIADVDIPGDLLESATWYQAPSGLKYIVEAYGIVFGALGDKLYYALAGKPWAWPVTNFIDFPAELKGIGIVPAGVMVFTKLKSFIITGTTPEVFIKRTVDENQGCTSHKSIQPAKTGLLWTSLEGVCNSAGVAVDVFSIQILGETNFSIYNSVFKNNVYYMQLTDGSITAVDFRYSPQIIKDLNLETTNLVIGNNLLLGYNTDTYFKLFDDTDYESMIFLSPVLLDGAYTNRKNFGSIYAYIVPPLTIEAFLNGNSVLTQSFTTEDAHELRWPQEEKNGYSVQFRITGTGSLRELDYVPVGRATT